MVDEVAGMADRERSVGLDQPRQVEAVDVLHGEDDALAEPGGVVGGDDVRVAQPGDGPDLPAEALEHAGAFDDLPPHDLEYLVAAHQRVVSQVDHAHPAPAELLPDLVFGVVGQARRERAGRRRSRGVHALVARRLSGLGLAHHGMACGPLDVADAPEEAIGRHLGDPLPAIRAPLQVLVDGLGQAVVELAQAVRAQGLFRRMRGRVGAHEIGLRVESGHAARANPERITRAVVTKRNERSEVVHHRVTEITEKNSWMPCETSPVPMELSWPILFLSKNFCLLCDLCASVVNHLNSQ